MKPRRRIQLLTPELAARGIRSLFARDIPKTWDDYFAPGFQLTAYSAAKMIEEQCGCDFKTADDAAFLAMPELYANYWEALREREAIAA